MFIRTYDQRAAIIGATPVTKLSFKQLAAVIDYVGVSPARSYREACVEFDFDRRLSDVVQSCGYKGGLNVFHRNEAFWTIIRDRTQSYGHAKFRPCASGGNISRHFQTKGAAPLVVPRNEVVYRDALAFADQVVEIVYEHEGDRIHRWHRVDDDGMDVFTIEAEFSFNGENEAVTYTIWVFDGVVSVRAGDREVVEYLSIGDFEQFGLPRRVPVEDVKFLLDESASRRWHLEMQIAELQMHLDYETQLVEHLTRSHARPNHDNTCLLPQEPR